MKIKGITSGTYLTKRIKEKKNKKYKKEELCKKCEYSDICKYKELGKFNKGKVFENNVECNYFYFTITVKAVLTIGRDTTTGKIMTQTFTGKNEDEAINKALTTKLELEKNGGIKIITKSNKTIIDLVSKVIDENFKLGKIKKATRKRKLDTLKKLQKEKFTTKPISKVTRDEVVKYLETLKAYSKSTIKQIYELICIAFGEASYQNIITENFMTGWKRVEKPTSEYESKHKVSLSIEEQKKLVEYLYNSSYNVCHHKYLFLLLLTTGMRIGEALVLDYEKDIDLENGLIYVRRTQTKDLNGKAIIGETTKTNNGQRILAMNTISKEIVEKALEHQIKNKDNLLFCKKDGTMYIENTVNSGLKRIALKLNISTYIGDDTKGNKVTKTMVHTHLLRGTFATRCAEAKIAPAVLKKILGHSDITVTMKYYIDVDNEFEKSENRNVEEYLKDKNIFGIDFELEKEQKVC